MKTKELIKNLENLGLRAEQGKESTYYLVYKDEERAKVASFSTDTLGGTSTNFKNFKEVLDHETQIQLITLLNLYALTEVEDRDEEKFYIKDINENHLNHGLISNSYFISDKKQMQDLQTQFTRSEVDELFKENPILKSMFYRERVLEND